GAHNSQTKGRRASQGLGASPWASRQTHSALSSGEWRATFHSAASFSLIFLPESTREESQSQPLTVHEGLQIFSKTLRTKHGFMEEMSVFLGPIVFVQSLATSILLCSSILHLTLISTKSVKFYAVAMFVTFEMGELYLYCQMGTELQH
ncbi:Protein of unknown function, partial [Gryllus bimaculatus]